jgi:hypothetical protein
MLPRSSLISCTLLAGALLWLGTPRAASQLVEKKQALVIGYPTTGIVISDSEPVYKGLVYVKVYPISPAIVAKEGAGPIVTAQLGPSQRSVSQLALGEYEVHYAIRNGSEQRTLIHRDVILRPEQASALPVEINGDAKTTIIGGDVTAQRMAESIRGLQGEVAALKKAVADLQRK